MCGARSNRLEGLNASLTISSTMEVRCRQLRPRLSSLISAPERVDTDFLRNAGNLLFFFEALCFGGLTLPFTSTRCFSSTGVSNAARPVLTISSCCQMTRRTEGVGQGFAVAAACAVAPRGKYYRDSSPHDSP